MFNFKLTKHVLRYTYLWAIAGILLYSPPISIALNIVGFTTILFSTISVYKDKFPKMAKFSVTVIYILSINLILQTAYYQIYLKYIISSSSLLIKSAIQRDLLICISFMLLLSITILIYNIYKISLKRFTKYIIPTSVFYNGILYLILTVVSFCVIEFGKNSHINNIIMMLIFLNISLIFVLLCWKIGYDDGYEIILALSFVLPSSYITSNNIISMIFSMMVSISINYLLFIMIQINLGHFKKDIEIS